jgi:hypothetical protein
MISQSERISGHVGLDVKSVEVEPVEVMPKAPKAKLSLEAAGISRKH